MCALVLPAQAVDENIPVALHVTVELDEHLPVRPCQAGLADDPSPGRADDMLKIGAGDPVAAFRRGRARYATATSARRDHD
jgi:hypothetical protein